LTTSAALSEQSLHAFAALAKSHLLQDLVSRTAPANACTHAAPTSSACSRERAGHWPPPPLRDLDVQHGPGPIFCPVRQSEKSDGIRPFASGTARDASAQ
jgi:hypothetical protein